MDKRLHYTIFVLLASLCMINAITYINECQTLNSAGETYILNASIEQPLSDNCLIINSDNITLDCDGHSVIKNNDFTNIGIRLNSKNLIIDNCTIINFQIGLYISKENNNTILNNNIINSSSDGIHISMSNDTTILNNYIFNSGRYGLFIPAYSYNSTLVNNTILYSGSRGLFFYRDTNNFTINNTITCFSENDDVYDNSGLGNYYDNITYDSIYNFNSTINNGSPCPSIISVEAEITPDEPESKDIIWCGIDNLILNPNQAISEVFINLSFYNDGVLYDSLYSDCIDEDCLIKVNWYKTSSGENWTCVADTVLVTFEEIINDTATIDLSSTVFEFETDENVFTTLISTFNTTYLFWILPLFAMGVIGLISRKISTTALGTAILCIPMFVFFSNTTFILVAVVLFIGGLGAKKMGF